MGLIKKEYDIGMLATRYSIYIGKGKALYSYVPDGWEKDAARRVERELIKAYEDYNHPKGDTWVI